MKYFSIIENLKRRLSGYGPLLLLFQRLPIVQALFPEANFLASSAALNSTSFVIATVVGLGAYDSVAGATTVVQISPAPNSSTVSVTSGVSVNARFQVVGNTNGAPESWSVFSGTLPTGLTLSNSPGNLAILSGTTTSLGSHIVTIRAWQSPGFTGDSASGNFNIQVAPPPPAAISVQPVPTAINSGQTATLTVTATGGLPLTYQWYQGNSADTMTTVGTNSASFTTPVLTSTTSYWVRVTNSANPSGADSNTATVTVRQPAAITTQPAPRTINRGQNTTLSVVASGDAPLTYQWFQGASGITTNPVANSNSDSFITPILTATTSYWVKVTNIANSSGALSDAATVTVRQPAAITADPASTTINSGQTAMLSVVASGDAPFTYQWYEGASGVTTNPVAGATFDSFTTPVLTTTTSYWVKVTNIANPVGANSAAAKVTVLLVTPPYAHAMSQSDGLITPSARGSANTTYFGWSAFNDAGSRDQPIDDSTPDIGTTSDGANFQTTNSEDHVLENGAFSFSNGSLAEQITVPTSGTAGPDGFTTIVLQIAAPSGFGAFPGSITLGDINGVTPTVVQGLNHAGDGQLWAKWELPGNQASYIIPISGDPGQADFSFDSVVVDTLYSSDGFMPDTVAAVPPDITTASPLPVTFVGASYSQPLTAAGGTAPYQFIVSAGALPDGLSLTTGGLLSGTPTAAVVSHFTVLIYDANILIATKDYDLTVTTLPAISTPSPLATSLVGVAYSSPLAASGGTTPYAWTLIGGALPDGLGLTSDGILSGTPTTVGTSDFTVQVRDANGFTDTRDYSITFSDLTIITTVLPTSVKNVGYNFGLGGTGGTLAYTWTVTSGSLPAGITLSSAGVLSGIPTGSSDATFTVRLKDSTNFSVQRQLTLPVSATFLPPILQPIDFPTITIGTNFKYTVSALNYPKTFAITGLPAGLKFVAATGVISGHADVAGIFNVQVRATNPGGKSDLATAPLIVKALDKNLVGAFTGLVARDTGVNHGLGGSLTVTTTINGSYTLKLVGALANSGAGAASASYSAKGQLAATAPQISISLGGQTLSLTFDAANGQMTGTLGAAPVTGWRSAWDAAENPADSLVGYYSFALNLTDAPDRSNATIPQGAGFATATIGTAGTLSIAGKTADGESITSSTLLGPNDEFAVYTPLYKNQGTIQGQLSLTEDVNGLFVGNNIAGALTWFKPTPTVATHTYPATFGPVNLTAEGAYLAPANKGNVILGLPEGGSSVQLNFTDGGLTSSATQPDMSFTYTGDNKVILPSAPADNPGKVAITINANTGAVAGNFTLVETTPPLTRSKVPFQGQIVRLSDGTIKAVGYFLLQQIPDAGKAATTAAILSGGISLTSSGVLSNGHTSGLVGNDLAITTIMLPTAVKTAAYNVSLDGAGGTLPYTWTLDSGALPAGITLSSAGVLSGIPTGSGDATFTVRLTDNTSFSVVKQLTLPVSATFQPPIVNPITFPTVPVGADFTFTVSAQNYPKTFSITGLPKSMKFVGATGVISGHADVPGVYNIQVRATNPGGSSSLITIPLTVTALEANLVGSFSGLIARDPDTNRDLGGSLSVTTSSSGSYTLKVVSALSNSAAAAASASYAATGRLADAAPQISILLGGQALALTINPVNGQVTGTLGNAAITGWRAAWNALANPATSLQGYYSMAFSLTDLQDQSNAAIPHGTGFATATASLGGAVVITGKTADGESITSSTVLGPNGEFGIYSPLYKNQDTILGQLSLTEDVEGLYAGNTIGGSLTWFKPTPTAATHTYPDSFGPVNLTAEGAYLAPASKGSVILGLPDAGTVQLGFTGGGLSNSVTNPDMSFTYTDDNKVLLPPLAADNPGKVAITINANTGAVSGAFTLVETSPPLTRPKVPFQGQIVRLNDGAVKAVGYFLLPQIPDPGKAANTAPILSGAFSLKQTNR